MGNLAGKRNLSEASHTPCFICFVCACVCLTRQGKLQRGLFSRLLKVREIILPAYLTQLFPLHFQKLPRLMVFVWAWINANLFQFPCNLGCFDCSCTKCQDNGAWGCLHPTFLQNKYCQQSLYLLKKRGWKRGGKKGRKGEG